MKQKRRFLVIGSFIFLFLFLFIASGSGGSVLFAANTIDQVKIAPEGGVLLADNLPVQEAPASSTLLPPWNSLSNMRQSVKQVNGGGYHAGFIYIPGGIINSTGPVLNGSMQHYEIATDRWRIEAELMDTTVADAAICTDAGGKIHVINGTDGTSHLSVHQVYNPGAPSGSRWSTATAPSVGGNNYFSQASGCVVINHILYLFGGYGNIGAGSPAPLADTWSWNPQTDTWSDTGFSMNTARFWFGYGSKSNNGYVAGGTDDDVTNIPLDSTERFIPGTGWQSLMDLPVALLAPGLVGTEPGVFVFGGAEWNGSSFVPRLETYLCDGSCPPNFLWNDTGFNLISARWFAGYAGGPPVGPYAAGGRVTANTGSLKTSERFQSP